MFFLILIIGLFLVSWVVSTIIYKVKKYDDIEVNIAAPKRELSGSTGRL